jgi:hypothetical protein
MAACKTAASNAVSDQVKAANRQAMTGALTGVATAALTGGVSAITSGIGSTATTAAQTGVQSSQGAQGTIQGQYDTTYNNCMYAAGNNVPGMAPIQPPPAEEQAYVPPAVVRDPLVMHVQQGLVQLGYLHGGADGVAGPKTAAAIRQYETDKGLPVDGVSSRGLLASVQTAEAGAPAHALTEQPAVDTSGGKWAMPPPPAAVTPVSATK